MRRGLFNVHFGAPNVRWPSFYNAGNCFQWNPTNEELYQLERCCYDVRLNRANTTYLHHCSYEMYMNYGFNDFSGYTYSGGVSGTRPEQTRYTQTPLAITLKANGSDQLSVSASLVKVLTNLSVWNRTVTKSLTSETDTTTNTLSVATFTRTNTLSVHDGSYTRFLNVSAHTNTNTLSAKFLTTTNFLSTLSGTYSNFLDVFNHTNTRTLSVKDITWTNYLSALSGTYSNFLNVLHHTNTETLSVEILTTTDFLSALSATYTNTLSVLNGTSTRFLNVSTHTNTNTLSVKDHTYSNSINANLVDIANQTIIGSNTLGNAINYLYKDSSGFVEVDGHLYYSAQVVDHLVQWLSGLGDRIYDWYQLGGSGQHYSLRHTMSYPVSSNEFYQNQVHGRYFQAFQPTYYSEPIVGNCNNYLTPYQTNNPYNDGVPNTIVATVIGKGNNGGTVWGNNVVGYTDDSDFRVAAVHAGLVADGQTKQIRFRNLGVKNSFIGTYENGVRSRDWSGNWCAIRLEAV